MIRTPVASSLRKLAGLRTAASSSTLPVPAFNQVKFVKEDVEKVMTELPDFSYYEMKESVPNPYQGTTMDRSILLDPPARKAVAAPKAEFSKLENGLKVASIDKQGLTASIGLYVSAGSRFETAANFGVSHMVSMMAYSSTAHLSQLRTVKTLEQLGCNATATCTAGREEIVYKVDVMREFVPLVIPMMIGNVLFPRLLPWEVKAAHKKVSQASAELAASPDEMVSSLLHKAAWCNNTLGLSPIATQRSMPAFTPDTIRSFMLDHFAPERMVVAGVNIDHAELSKWVMRSFADYNAIPVKKREEVKALYTGGDSRMEGPSPFCHVAIGFESVPWGQQELAPIALLQTILGSGSASASPAIGSGVTSRLATEVVKQSPFVESCAAFNMSYSDSGIFGVYGVSAPEKAGEMCTAILKTLKGSTTVSKDELAKAKAMLKGKLARQADDAPTIMADMGQQLVSGHYGSAADFAAIIDSVTEADVSAAAKKILSSKPTIAAFGDTHTVPHYGAIEAALK
mmetsp:Transcript_7012/g.17926  ORF Transcript_7012/g.17926 Transcript_7012/m.17926 type:complete len:514 (+) Transcript_7012:80-1621(+)